MLRGDARRRSLEGQHGVTRRFGRIDFARKRQGERAKASEQVRNPAGIAHGLANARNQRGLAVCSVACRKPPTGNVTGTPDKVIVAGTGS